MDRPDAPAVLPRLGRAGARLDELGMQVDAMERRAVEQYAELRGLVRAVRRDLDPVYRAAQVRAAERRLERARAA